MACKRLSVALSLGLFGLPLLPLAAPPDQRLEPAAAAAGKAIYLRFCASCHGKEAKGDGPIAADLRTPPPDLTKLAERNAGKYPLERVVRVIDGRDTARAHGTSDMPVWGDVFKRTAGTESPTVEAAVSRLGQYLWSIQQPAK